LHLAKFLDISVKLFFLYASSKLYCRHHKRFFSLCHSRRIDIKIKQILSYQVRGITFAISQAIFSFA